MANLVNAQAVSKAYGTTTVLDDVSLGVATGERIGVVGRNGGGKSTLLRLLTGLETPDSGRVTRTGGVSVAVVDQRGALPAGATVRDVVVGDAADYQWAGDSAVRSVLSGLGLHAVGLDSPVDRLSGGERRRVSLAAALVQQSDLLVLDEPTNHLDVEGVDWLAHYLVARRGALLVVTHDRWFLDAVSTRTWEVADGAVHQFDGGYAAYVLARAERSRQAAASESRRQNLIRKELAWLRRGAPARTSKPKFRLDAAAALIGDEPPPRDSVSLQALSARRLGRTVYDVEDVSLSAGSKSLLSHATWHVGPGDRVAVIGVNGSGKTHLLRLLTGSLMPSTGRVVIGQTVRAGYLSQDVSELPTSLRVVEAVNEVRERAVVDGVEITSAQLAERFGFPAARQWTPVADLSGGERRRLQLLRLLLAQPNVLLLDEPTNDLDTDTLTELEDLLDSWPGTVVVVSHDRYLIERVCDTTVALLGDGSIAALPGGVDEYLNRRRNAVDTSTSGRVSGPSASGPSASGSAASGPDAPGSAASGSSGSDPGSGKASGTSAAETRAARKELARLERRVNTLTSQESTLHGELAAHATDHVRVQELNAELTRVSNEREDLEQQWLELADQL